MSYKGKSAHDPEKISSSVHHGGACVMGWACMAASGTDSLIFIDEATRIINVDISRMDLKVYRNILSSIYRDMQPI